LQRFFSPNGERVNASGKLDKEAGRLFKLPKLAAGNECADPRLISGRSPPGRAALALMLRQGHDGVARTSTTGKINDSKPERQAQARRLISVTSPLKKGGHAHDTPSMDRDGAIS
jgi:hypothetical protein